MAHHVIDKLDSKRESLPTLYLSDRPYKVLGYDIEYSCPPPPEYWPNTKALVHAWRKLQGRIHINARLSPSQPPPVELIGETNPINVRIEGGSYRHTCRAWVMETVSGGPYGHTVKFRVRGKLRRRPR